jgi:signal transduction histidine kinase
MDSTDLVVKPESEGTASPARILIVDDEYKNRKLLEVMLAPDGFIFLTAASGAEALASAAVESPDLILLDVMMPDMDGYEVAFKLKATIGTKNIPIIMLTALDDRNARMLGLSAGAEDFLSKPVDRAELCVRVRNLLRLKTYGDKLAAALQALEFSNEQLGAALAEASEARRMAEHANNAKTQFLRAMSHELRTPLNAISGYTEILEMGIRGTVNPEQTKDLGRIKRAAAYLLRLINDILTIARMEGARPLNLVAIPVNQMLAEVDGLCALQAKARGLTLTITPCRGEVLVMADAERFQQILLNLLTNAIKFTPNGGSVEVTAYSVAGIFQLRVKDTGVGIRLLDIDRVFQPFVQIDRHLTSDTQQGVGLGLSISRELARAMHGDLTLQSIEGIGSTFTLTLPIASDISATSEASSAAEESPLRAALAS